MGSQRVRHDWVTNTPPTLLTKRRHTQTQWHILYVNFPWVFKATRKLFLYLVLVIYSFYIFLPAKFIHFNHSVVSDSLQPHELQHTRLPCPSTIPELAQTHVHQVSDAISSSVIPFFSCLQSFPASGSLPMGQFFHQVAKVMELQLQHQSFQWIFRADFFRIDWFDILAIQGTLKSLLQHHSSKASILWCSAFFMGHLSHPYLTTGKKPNFNCMDLGSQRNVSAL